MNNSENARKSIIAKVKKMENDNVLRSLCFVIGDYAVSENGEERANYIAAILLKIVDCAEIESLTKIYSCAKDFSEIESEKKV